MANIFLIVFVFFLGLTEARAFPTTPNPAETVGELCSTADSDFFQFRYNEQVPYCKRNVDSSLKQEIYEAYNIPKKCRTRYTIDHFIPLSFGGNNGIKNLWPEHKLVKATRLNLELKLFEALRDGRISQADAIKTITKAKMELQMPGHIKNLDESFINECDDIDLEK